MSGKPTFILTESRLVPSPPPSPTLRAGEGVSGFIFDSCFLKGFLSLRAFIAPPAVFAADRGDTGKTKRQGKRSPSPDDIDFGQGAVGGLDRQRGVQAEPERLRPKPEESGRRVRERIVP